MFMGVVKDMIKVNDVPVEKMTEMFQYRYPMKEIMIPMDDVVNTILFLLSDSAKMMTGSTLCIDGGFLTT